MKSQINKNSENDFSNWKKIYNDEQKIKGKKSEKKMSKIKNGGEMVNKKEKEYFILIMVIEKWVIILMINQ